MYKTSLNSGGQATKLPLKGLALPIGLAWDWLARNLYVLDQDTARIDLFVIESGYQRNILSNNLQRPTSLAVDPTTGCVVQLLRNVVLDLLCVC